ncbi:MAG: protein kinase [Myxococcota bacterium]|nr:protein kinase [Myxococcota bacterium]
MKTGDLVHDAQGRSYQVGPLLGRGLWGKSYLVRHGDSRAEFVLKTPLGRDDFKGDVPLTDTLLRACQDACKEQAELLGQSAQVFLPPLQSRASEDGSPLLILPRFTSTLDRRISQGCSLSEVLGVLLQTTEHLQTLQKESGAHGNLRPSNLLLNDRGEVLLVDMATASARKSLGQLHAISPEPNHYLPPEVLAGAAITTSTDTYALAAILYRAIHTPREGDAEGKAIPLPQAGLDKGALVELKNRAAARLADEDSNPRFHARFAEKVASVLNRALSREVHPSPPYRFSNLADLAARFQELRTLIRPEITTVGKIMLNRPPGSTTFETDEQVSFTVTVGASNGVSGHDEVAVGVALFDEESEERLRSVETRYTTEDHPSGRYRFRFDISDLTPGRYRVRLAFAVRESGHPPQTTEMVFEVRAAAGYVPPQPSASEPQALPFGRKEDEPKTAVTEPFREDLSQPRPLAPGEPSAPKPPPVAPAPPAISVSPTPSSFDEEPPTVAEPPPVAVRPTPVATVPSLDDVPPPPARPTAVPLSTEDLYEPEATEPHVSQSTQLPERDPLKDIVGAGSWTDLPLPGDARDDSAPPDLGDGPEPEPESPIARFVEMMRADPFLMLMVGGGALLLVLLIILIILKLT